MFSAARTLGRAAVGASLTLTTLFAACGGGDTSGGTPSAPAPTPTPVAAVTVTAPTPQLLVGATMQLSATTLDANGNALTGRTIAWSSSSAAATVSSTGLVTAVAPGTATITATSEGKSGSAALTITASAVISAASGDAQRGLTGKALADSLVIAVKTPTGAPAAGSSVTWTVSGGTLSAATSVADASGVARVQWTVGSGDATATASAPGATPAVFHANGRANGACTLATSASTASFGLGPSDYRLSLRPTQPHKAIALFVDFSDAPATEKISDLASNIIDGGYALINEYSYGRASYTATVDNKWYRMSQPSSAYGFSSLTFDKQKAYMQEAMTLADPDVDFSQYDVVYVFAAPTNNIPVSPTFNAFQGSGLVFDGHEIHNGITFGKDVRNSNPGMPASYGATVLAHESGHMMGLIDLYSLFGQDVSTPALYQSTIQKYVGAWSIMGWNSHAAHYLAWEKLKMGFLDASQVDCVDLTGGGVEDVVTPIETSGGVKAVVAQIDASRAIVAEVRTNTGSDAALCSTGVLVYKVDASAGTGTGAVVVIPSRQSTDQTKINTCGTYWDAPFDTVSGTNSYTDAASGVAITVLKAEANGGFRIRIKKS